jgi:Bacteriocin-protection, YdeI or OmpD-Associated/Domain of unknown function (DUF1905)
MSISKSWASGRKILLFLPLSLSPPSQTLNIRGCRSTSSPIARLHPLEVEARGWREYTVFMQKFQTVLLAAGKTATGIEVPASVVESFGSSKKPAVNVTINGYGYRSTVAVMGGKFMLPVSAEHRAGAKIVAGDKVNVTLELDAAPRVLEVPQDFLDALETDAAAKTFFEGLSYSNKRRFVLSIDEAKSAETRARRITKSVETLRAGKI